MFVSVMGLVTEGCALAGVCGFSFSRCCIGPVTPAQAWSSRARAHCEAVVCIMQTWFSFPTSLPPSSFFPLVLGIELGSPGN